MRILGYDHGIQSTRGCELASHSSDPFRINVSLLTACQQDGKVAQKVRYLIVIEHLGWAMYPHAPKHLRKGLNSPGNLGELLCLSLFFMRLAGRSLVTFLIRSFRFLDAC